MFVGCVVGRIMMIKIDPGGEVGLFFQIFKHRSDINTLHLDDKFYDMEVVSSGNIKLVRTNLGQLYKSKDIQHLVFPPQLYNHHK